MKKGKIFILSGPSGSGKTTLYKKLLASRKLAGRLVKSISMTTRSRRPGEKHGRDYLFVDEQAFLKMKKAGQFLESQKVFDNFYGTPKKFVEKLLAQGKHVLLAIDVKGAKVVSRKIPKAYRIFIKAPSWNDLKQRLQGRGSEHKDSVQLRLKTARRELKEAKNYDRVIVNDRLTHAFKELEAVVLAQIHGRD